MASGAAGIKAGRAYVEVGSEDSALQKGLKAAEKKLKSFGESVAKIGASLGAAGAAITAPILAAADGFAHAGAELLHMSMRTGVSVEALSALGFAASQTGTDMSVVELGIKRMQKALVSGSEENLQAEATFQALGLSVQNMMKLSPEQQFQALAKAISAIPSPTGRAGAAMQIFGRSGTDLIPLLAEMGELTGQAKELGLTMSIESAESALKLERAMGLVEVVTKKIWAVLGSALVPLLTEFAGTMARLSKTVLDWVAANKPLVVTIYRVGFALTIAGTAFVALGAAIAGAGIVLGGVATAIGVIGTVLGAILSPIGLIVVGLVGLTAWFLTSTQTGGQAMAWLGERFGELLADAKAAFGGIANALKAGDIALAGKILWVGLKIEWLKGVGFLQGVWADWGVAAVTVFRSVSYNIASLMTDAWANIQSGFVSAAAFLTNTWTSFIGVLQKSWNSFGGFFAKVWERIKALFKGEDPTEAVAKINAATAEKNAGVDQDTAVRRGVGGAVKDVQLSEIDKRRQAAQEDINRQEKADLEARRKAAGGGLAGSAAELAKAQEELKALTAQAATEAGAVGKEPGAKGPKKFEAPDLGGLEKAAQKLDVKGTFSGAALRGLGIGDTATEQLKEQKKTNDQLTRLNQRAAQGRLVFTS